MTDSLFPDSASAGLVASGDATPQNVATVFTVSDNTHQCVGLRVFVPSAAGFNPGATFTAVLWGSNDQGTNYATWAVLTSKTFTNLTPGQWITVTWDTPVNLSAYQDVAGFAGVGHNYYAVGINFPNGNYGGEHNVFASAVTSPTDTALIGPQSLAGGNHAGNALFIDNPTTPTTPPNTSYQASWYGVDPLTVNTGGGGGGGGGGGSGSGIPWTPSGPPASPAYSTVTATGTATDPLAASTTNSDTINISTPVAPRILTRGLFDSRINWGSALDFSVLGPSFGDDGNPLTIAVQFYVLWDCGFKGLKIYKNPNASGPITFYLWDANGNMLATTTATWAADAGGWREIDFPQAIQLSSMNSPLYYAGYYTPQGRYAFSHNIFAALDFCSPPLVVPFNTDDFNPHGGSYFQQGANAFPTHSTTTNYYIAPVVEWQDAMPGYAPGYYSQFPNGAPPSGVRGGFPMAIWSPPPETIQEYAALGINLMIAGFSHSGYKEAIIACNQAGHTFDHWPLVDYGDDYTGGTVFDVLNDPAYGACVTGYYMSDEPDLVKLPLTPGGPPEYRSPTVFQGWINLVRDIDSTRPMMIGLSEISGFNGNFYALSPDGEGKMTSYNKSLLAYSDMSDMLDGDMYALASTDDLETNGAVGGVWSQGVFAARLREITRDRKPFFLDIETTSSKPGEPTPDQVTKAVWAGLISGARGIVFFDIHFAGAYWPTNNFATMFSTDVTAGMTTAIQNLCTQVQSLAGPLMENDANLVSSAVSDNTSAGPVGGVFGVPPHYTTRVHNGVNYLFAMGYRPGAANITFTIPTAPNKTLTVIGENRTVTTDANGVFTDSFPADYTVHLYQWT
jgi:hypothetical protein